MLTQGVLILLGLNALCGSIQANDEVRLLHHLLDNYDSMMRLARPVKKSNESMKVQFGLELIRINKLDEENGDGEFSVWDELGWTDTRLTWDPTEYGGIKHINILPKNIWMPDVVQYNSLHKDEDLLGEDARVIASYDGRVTYIPPKIRHIGCSKSKKGSGNIECTFKMGSWSYNGYLLDIGFYGDKAQIDVTNYQLNDKYKIVSHGAKRNVVYYECCPEPYIDLTFNLVLKAN